MPRDSSGNYSKPPGTTAIPNTTIESAPYNALQDDMAEALTESLPRDGSAPMHGELDMGGQRIIGLGAPQSDTDAATFGSVDEAVAKFGLGVPEGPLLADFNDAGVPAGFYRWDASTANAPHSTGGGGAIKLNRDGGRALWIASRSAASNSAPQLFLKNTSGSAGDWGPWEEVYHTGNLPSDLVTEGRTLTAGDGLTGGGNLSANRSFAVDGTVVRTSRNLTAGDGLSGGGNLGSNRSFAVDSSVVRTSGNQTISGTKNFTGNLQTSGQAVVPANRSISAGDGLSGGGSLASNRSLAVDSSVVRTSRTISAGDGLSGGGNLSGNRSLAVDSSVVRTSRSISAGSGLSGGGNLSGNRTISINTNNDRGVGSYCLCEVNDDAVASGSTTPGSNLSLARGNANAEWGGSNTSPSGTWRNMALAVDQSPVIHGRRGFGLFMRVS